MYFVDRTAVVLKPTSVYLAWLKQSDVDFPDITIEQLRANCNVFLVPQFDEPEQVISYFDERYEHIFAAELASWGFEENEFPKDMSLQAFWTFFELEIHDSVVDLEEAQWNINPVLDNMR